jgi:hypothetical protein
MKDVFNLDKELEKLDSPELLFSWLRVRYIGDEKV